LYVGKARSGLSFGMCGRSIGKSCDTNSRGRIRGQQKILHF
jgi:hypothetical protein